MRRKYEINMCEGSIIKNIMLFAIPLVLSGMLQLLYNAADIVVVGRFAGSASLAAVGSTGSIINLFINVFVGLSIGVNVIMSRAFGANDRNNASKTSHTAIALGFLSGIIVLLLGVILSKAMLAAMDTPADVIDLSTLYLRIYFLGAPANMVYNFGSGILRAMGDTRRPLYFLTASGIVNVLLNLFFVIKLKMDVAGVALATIISQYISAILVLNCLKDIEGMFEFKKLKIHKKALTDILKTGLPAGVQSVLFALSNVIIQSAINSFGSIAMAGNAAAGNVEGFVYIAMNAFHHAIITFNGQNLGGGNISRIKKGLPTATVMVSLTGILLSTVVILLAPMLLGFYSTDPAVIEMGILRMKYVCTTYFLCGIMEVVTGAMRGLGYSIAPMVVSLLGACVFRIIWIYTIFNAIPTYGMLYVSYPVSWAITSAAHFVCYASISKKVFAKINERRAVM